MKRFRIEIVSVMLVLCCRGACAQGTNASRETFEGLVGEWIELRSQIAAERRDWQQKESQWTLELSLLETEKAALDKQIAAEATSTSTVQQELEDLLARKARLSLSLQRMTPVLDRAEARLRAWKRLIPAPLFVPLAKSFAEIPTTHQDGVSLPVSRRIQLVITLYTQIETLQHNLHLTREVLATTGEKRREVEVLYVGLAKAFAVSPDNSWAAVGTVDAEGWSWKSTPELATQVRKAIDVLNKHAPAELVGLPLQATEVSDGRTDESSQTE